MNQANSEVSTSIVEGVVIGTDIGSWSGFESGRIIVLDQGRKRTTLQYVRKSQGPLPQVGDSVEVTYSGNLLLEITNIRILDRERVSISKRVAKEVTDIHLIAGHPKGAFFMSFVEVIAGISLLIMGFLLGGSRPAAYPIFGVVGVAQFIIAGFIWEFTGGV
jgi:hypothetical protein